MKRLLLADRVKQESDSFLTPLLPALRQEFDIRFVSLPPGDALALAIGWADIVWLEWCVDHAVWATRSGVLAGKRCLLRLHSFEALETDHPARVAWPAIETLILVSVDIADLLRQRFPAMPADLPVRIIPNGIDPEKFAPGAPDPFRIAWVGNLEPKKNPSLLLQIAQVLRARDPRYRFDIAGAWTDLRTERYMRAMIPHLGLAGHVRCHGPVRDIAGWYADKGVILSTSLYESFGMNIGEAAARGAFPVVHEFPGAARIWPPECLFAGVDEAVDLIKAAVPHRYRSWVLERYALALQVRAVLGLLRGEEDSAMPAAHGSISLHANRAACNASLAAPIGTV